MIPKDLSPPQSTSRGEEETGNQEAARREGGGWREESQEGREEVQAGNQALSSPHLTDEQSQTEMGHSVHSPYFVYCITLYFLNICDFLPFGEGGRGGESKPSLPQGQVIRGSGA